MEQKACAKTATQEYTYDSVILASFVQARVTIRMLKNRVWGLCGIR